MTIPSYRSSYDPGSFTFGDLVLNVPAGTADNDILIAVIEVGESGTPSTANGSFTGVVNATSGGMTLYVGWKRAASESGSYTFTRTGGNWQNGFMVAVQNCILSGSPFDVVGTTNHEASTSTPTGLSITTTVANTLVVMATVSYDGYTGSAPSGMTERVDSASGAGQWHDLSFPSAGATGDKVASIAGGSSTRSVLFALKEEAGGGGGPTVKALAALGVG